MGRFDVLGERTSFAAQEESAQVRFEAVPRLAGAGALSREECAVLLAASYVGRIAISVGALPVIMPVNYLAFKGAVWFRASSSGTLLRASVGSVVAFEADGYEEIGLFGWSVLLRGVADEVRDPRKLEEVRLHFVEAWPLGEDADHYTVVPATMLSGQRYAQGGVSAQGSIRDR